jgi:hypothetical protein
VNIAPPRSLYAGLAMFSLLMARTLHAAEPASTNAPPAASTNGNPVPLTRLAPTNHPGYKQALVTCTRCHLLPDPSLLPRNIWADVVLKKMAFYTGIVQLDVESHKEGKLYKASGLFPDKPALSREAWDQIESYFLQYAPVGDLPHPPRDEINIGLPHFELEPPRFRREPPLTSLVQIDPDEHVIFAADAGEQNLFVLNSGGELLGSLPAGGVPVWMKRAEGRIYLACIGHIFAREERLGQLTVLERRPEGLNRKVLFDHLPRPCHVEVADVNGDGRPDILLCMFGYLTGKFSWFENRGEDNYTEHVLYDKAGPVVSVVRDFDGDGKPDIALLVGQEAETLIIYYGDGKGGFPRTAQVFKKPPTYGHTYFETADFDGDGRLDFLVCNGDNGDYDSPAKPYHGIRIYFDRGGGRYEEGFFYLLHGAFRAIARDFDHDGKLDIAVNCFYPDYDKSPRESFVFLHNEGNLKFKASTFKECINGRWLCMDVGDLNGDGELDIVLGSMIRMPGSSVPSFVRDTWETTGPSVVILRNTLKRPPAAPTN